MMVIPELAEWDGFYVIVGSAAGALIGLQFVMMTLIADRQPPDAARAGAAFSSPTIVHFAAALFLSALLHAPWRTMRAPAAIWGALGLGGVVYAAIVGRRMRQQSAYRPVFEDWVNYFALPLVGYAVLAVSAFTTRYWRRESLFVAGAAAVLLLFMGIRNSWDSITHLALTRWRDGGMS